MSEQTKSASVNKLERLIEDLKLLEYFENPIEHLETKKLIERLEGYGNPNTIELHEEMQNLVNDLNGAANCLHRLKTKRIGKTD